MHPFPVPAITPVAQRLLAWLLIALALCAAGVAQAGTTYRFGGPGVANCDRSQKVYTCSALPLTAWDDAMVIEDGYTVNVTSSVTFGYNHSLTMSGSARLTSSGDLNIGDIRPSGTLISGGSFHANGKFTIGNQNQKITANITASSMQLGSGSQLEITGTIKASGPVAIASHARINGPVTGADITTNSPVVLNGNIDAKGGRFTLASGSTVNGSVTAQVADLLASNSIVTGKVTATQTLTLGSSVTVNGDIDTGVLTLQSSEAIIKGDAIVDRADLFWHGRVSELIECRSGATVGDCSCVNNQSGYEFNSTLGPKCGKVSPPNPNKLSHFLIEHDGNDIATCSSKNVTVSACTNADCSQKLSTATSVIMQPGGASVTFTGSGTAGITSARKGINQLSLTLDGAATTFRCRNTRNNSASCDINFTGDVGFKVAVPNHKAGNWVTAELQALKSDGTECKPAFVNVTKPVQYSCNFTEPKAGTLPVRLARTPANKPTDPVELACASNKLVQWDTRFDAEAKAQIGLTHTDAGKVTLNAKTDEASGAGIFTAAPDHFVIDAPSPWRAGLDFEVSLTAMNADKVKTPNFDKAGYAAAGATRTAVSMLCNSLQEALQPAETEFSGGQAKLALNFPEAGWINLQAKLENFLGSGVTTVSTTGDAAANPCKAAVGPFLPMYFQVELNDTARILSKDGKDLSYYYSREPIPLKITAMNAKGQPTTNYPSVVGSDHAFSVSAVGIDGAPLKAGLGTLLGTLAATDFVDGVAKPTPARKSLQATFQFTTAPTAPTPIRLRVENKAATGTLPAGHGIKSADDPAYAALAPEKARPEIRSGRLRIASRFGRVGAPLELPVTAEYWTGSSWVLNDRDGFSLVPGGAIAQTAVADSRGNGAKPQVPVHGNVQLSGGTAKLQVTGSAAGWIDIAFNLGAGTAQDQSCLKVAPVPASTGAGLPWLQSAAGCVDPSGRATFGIFAPESRRIIHVREVFN